MFPNDVGVGIIGGPHMVEDPWSLAMKGVDHLFNQLYGDMERYAQGHVPQIQDRKIWADLKKKIGVFGLFNQTSAHRFRGATDLVPPFTYWNFITGRKVD